MKRIALVPFACMFLLSCDAPPETIAGKVQDGVLKVCQFHANEAWLTDIIVKADVTIQLADQLVKKICDGVTAAYGNETQGLLQATPCQYGEIEIAGEKVCIEGEPVATPPKEDDEK